MRDILESLEERDDGPGRTDSLHWEEEGPIDVPIEPSDRRLDTYDDESEERDEA